MLRFVVFSLMCFMAVDSARILGLFPAPSISHQVVFRALTQDLAKRGHELVIVTPNPALAKDRPPDNVTEIDISFGYKRLMELMTINKSVFKRGVIVGAEEQLNPANQYKLISIVVEMMECPELKKIAEDKTQHFDLIIAEAFMNYHLIYSEIFKAPVILFTSFHGFPETFEAVGAPARHPTLYQSVLSDLYGGVTLIDKFKQAKFEYDYYNAAKHLEAIENQYLKLNYGPNTPTVKELRNNINLVFINSHPVFCDNKPLPPNVVYVGPLHMQPLKELPQDLKQYLDNSTTGVIYVSLGTNVHTANMEKDLLEGFVEGFRALPYDILWKFNGDEIENLPNNVKIEKWFPQRDLLAHPKIKLFVMQGGLQSTDEAIDAEVPLVGIPMLGDQYFNVHKYEQLGIGVKVDALTLDKDSLLKGIKTVLNDESYKKHIKKWKQIMNDHPQSSLQRAVWWTEYVIRHKGAKHLKSPAANMCWAEYFMLDLVGVIVAVILAAVVVVSLVVKCLISSMFRSTKVKKS